MNFLKKVIGCLWLFSVVALTSTALFADAKSGLLQKHDKHGVSITLEWHKADDAARLTRVMKPLIPVLADAFADDAALFRKFFFDEGTQAIKAEYAELLQGLPAEMLQIIEKNIQLGGQDKQTRIAGTLKKYEQSFSDELLTKWVPAAPFVVIAKEGDKILGVTLFCRMSLEPGFDLPAHAVYLDELGVASDAQGRGIGRLLIFSAFELMPDVTQICLDTGVWNTKAQAVYERLGFCKRECKEIGHVGYQFIKKLSLS